MTFFRTLRSAFSSLINNKLRSFLTTLGVIIGVAAVIIMVAVSAGAEAVIAEQINSLGADLIIISASRGTPGAAKTLIYDDAVAIQNEINGVTGVASEQAPAPQTIKAGSLIFEADELGTTVDFPSVRDAPVGDGRFFTEDEVDGARKVVVLGSGLAKDLYGDEYAIGQSLSVGTTQFTVIGVMAPKGNVGGIDYDGRVYMPITVVFQKFVTSQLASDKVKTIYAQSESKETLDNTILQIEALLARRHNVSAEQPDFTVQTQQDIISTQEATTEAFRALLAWVAGVSLLVGGIGIMNIMLVSVTERTQEIGTRQAIGATPADIRRQFLIEALALSLIGGLIGVGAGIGGAWLFGQSGDLRTVVVPSSIVIAFGAALVVGVFFGYFPANKAAQLDPIEALRHE